MKAVRYHGPNQPFRLEEVRRPEPASGEVLVRITAAGMCHTELHFRHGLLDLGVRPVTMGHEAVGRIAAVGAAVPQSRIGERVVCYYYEGCGACDYCRVGDENLCAALRAQYGFLSDGAYAEYMVLPAGNAVPLPASISDIDAAPIGCAVTTAIHAARLARPALGEWLVVYGIGAVGLALVQLLSASGGRVVAVSRTPAKLAQAAAAGAEATVDASAGSAAEAIRQLTGGGADAVFECVGTAESMAQATPALGRRGRLCFIGYSEAALSVHPIQLIVGEQRVMGSVGATLAELYQAVDLVARGVVQTTIDRTLPLAEFEQGLTALEEGRAIGRIVLLPEARP